MRIAAAVTASIMLAAAVCGCTPLDVVNGLAPTDTYIAATDVEYGSDPREKLDVYRPGLPPDARAADDMAPVP